MFLFQFNKLLRSSSSSSRWCPTQEQLVILEEIYRGGMRTPNASQIQHITARLSFYGKIEGKNVFYWFQNHKARDRQQLRRRLNKQLQLQQQHRQLSNYYLHLNHHYNHNLHSHSLMTASSSPQHPFCTTLASFSQGGAGEASRQGMDYKWRIGNTEGVMMEQTLLKQDWRRTMMMEVSSSNSGGASYWPAERTLKTLELFPIRDRLKQV